MGFYEFKMGLLGKQLEGATGRAERRKKHYIRRMDEERLRREIREQRERYKIESIKSNIGGVSRNIASGVAKGIKATGSTLSAVRTELDKTFKDIRSTFPKPPKGKKGKKGYDPFRMNW